MVDANEKDKTPKSESSPGNDAVEKDEAPLNLSNDMENEEDDDDDEYEYDDDDDDDDDDEDEDGDEEPEDEPEEEKVNDGGNTVEEVKNVETKKENVVKDDGKEGEEPKSNKKSGDILKSKEKRPKSRNTKKNEQKDSGTLAANGDKPESSTKKKAVNRDKPESSNKKKGSKRIATMGMVFMCSSKTKADCFRYKILGLPESKKDQVLKIYEGMRLFLFDVDLRLMYGIFKAAGPGGYNIEPKAFKSEFPSQVRFTMLHDCLPLAEEKFKSALKENYYSRNKFEGLLKSDQVKKLCKLFREGRDRSAGKSRRNRTRAPARVTETRLSRPNESYRDRLDDRHTSRAAEKRKRRARDEERRPRSPPPREKRRYTDYDRPLVVYDRELPVPRYLPPQPTAIPSPMGYTYERQPLDGPPYIRDHVPEPPTYRIVDRDRERDRDPYLAYTRDPPPPLYREPVYPVPPPPEYHILSREYHRPSAVEAPEYRIPGGSRVLSYRDAELAGDYRPAAALPEYRSRTHYKYQL